MDGKSILFSVAIVVMLAAAAGMFFYSKISAVVETTDSLSGFLDQNCPEDARIEDYAETIASFLSPDTGLFHPGYAVDKFEQYYVCAHTKFVFTRAEIELYEPNIIDCGILAYNEYIKELNDKLEELEDDMTDSGEADKKYNRDLLKEYTHRAGALQGTYTDKTLKQICVYEKGGFPTCENFFYSDPELDGWGWEDNKSCKVSTDVCSMYTVSVMDRTDDLMARAIATGNFIGVIKEMKNFEMCLNTRKMPDAEVGLDYEEAINLCAHKAYYLLLKDVEAGKNSDLGDYPSVDVLKKEFEDYYGSGSDEKSMICVDKAPESAAAGDCFSKTIC